MTEQAPVAEGDDNYTRVARAAAASSRRVDSGQQVRLVQSGGRLGGLFICRYFASVFIFLRCHVTAFLDTSPHLGTLKTLPPANGAPTTHTSPPLRYSQVISESSICRQKGEEARRRLSAIRWNGCRQTLGRKVHLALFCR